MRENLGLLPAAEPAPESAAEACAVGIGPCLFEATQAPEQAARLRALLQGFVQRAATGTLPVALADAAGTEVARGEGHFHLAPELFLQVSGHTRFSFPHGQHLLGPGQALLLPPRLRHAETVGAAPGESFANVVIYTDGASLSCHLAHQTAPGRPGILHLEARRHAQAPRIHDWLRDATLLGPAGTAAEPAAAWATAQLRALVAAATAGVLRMLDDTEATEPPEPALVARVRVLVQNQLGDPALSVRRLADQLGCTPDYLSHRFGRTAGEHLAAFIARQRLERGARLLADTAMAGKEVAWACGFATQSYFIRSFRGHFGVTPKAWRAAREAAAA